MNTLGKLRKQISRNPKKMDNKTKKSFIRMNGYNIKIGREKN